MSSSSEEDTSFLQDCIYQVPGKPIGDNTQNAPVPPSNRVLPDEHKQFDYKNLKVSNAFQKHVSKHLESLLDKTTFVEPNKKVKIKKEKKTSPKLCGKSLPSSPAKHFVKIKKEKNAPPKLGGITLLSSSAKQLVIEDSAPKVVSQKRRLKRERGYVGDAELERRAKEVAVTPQYVLSKEEIRHWAPETKGTVELVRYNKAAHKK